MNNKELSTDNVARDNIAFYFVLLTHRLYPKSGGFLI